MFGICQRFIKTCRRVKSRTKIMQSELGISLKTAYIEASLPKQLEKCSTPWYNSVDKHY